MESNVRRPFFPTAKDISEGDTDKKVNFEFSNAVKGKPYLNKCQYDDYNASFAIQWLQSHLIFVASFGMELYNPSHFKVLEEGEGPEPSESHACHTSKEAEKYA